MPLQAVTKTDLAMKSRARDTLGISDKIQGASKRVSRLVMTPRQGQNIAQAFIQTRPAFTKPFLACARDLPDGRFVETYRLRIGERGLWSFSSWPEMKYRPIGPISPCLGISQRS